MEKNEIISRLKTKFKSLGFSDDAFDGVAAYLGETDDEKMDDAIAGVEPILKSMNTAMERRVTKAVETAKKDATKPQQQPGAGAAGQPEPNPNPQQGNDPQNIASIIQAALAPMQQQLTALQNEKASNANAQKVFAALKDKVPDTYIKQRVKGAELKDEETTNAVIQEITEGWTELSGVIPAGNSGQSTPMAGLPAGAADSKASKEVIDAVVKSII